ncbi:MAG: hypothetical protein M1834_005062 [Cirrosporium novae-zelandiae]|nr:MAG: hypothetical protein M1834_005062 [Cirrosporium novae-zelandiae]
MFGWGDADDAHRQVYREDGGPEHQAKLSHELIAGGAAFEGFKKFEDHQRAEGKPVNHAFAKEVLVGFVGGEVDRLAETKGMDFADKERAKHQAKKHAEEMYDSHYGENDQYDPSMRPPDHIDRYGNY